MSDYIHHAALHVPSIYLLEVNSTHGVQSCRQKKMDMENIYNLYIHGTRVLKPASRQLGQYIVYGVVRV